KRFDSFIPFHHSPLGSSWSWPNKRPPALGNSSTTTTDKSYSLHWIAADNPAGPAPMMTISFISFMISCLPLYILDMFLGVVLHYSDLMDLVVPAHFG